jgi:hypothetical protein
MSSDTGAMGNDASSRVRTGAAPCAPSWTSAW